MESYHYYIIGNAYSVSERDKKDSCKIVKRANSQPLLIASGDNFEGPYVTLAILKEKSTLIKKLKMLSAKAYQNTINEKNFIMVTDVIKTAADATYSFDYIAAFEHTTKGRGNKNVGGGHFLKGDQIRIVNEIGVNYLGVIKAFIEIYNGNTNKWMPKEHETTLFPRSWDYQKLFDEFIYTSEQLVKVETAEYKYRAQTTCGIEVEFIKRDNKIISFYPIF